MDSSRIKSIRAGNRAAVTKFFKKLDELNTDSEMDIDIAGPIIDAIVKKQSIVSVIFSDKSEVYIRGLESLGQCQDTYGSLLIPVMLGKLPITVKSNITRENGNDDWTLGNLRKAIQREISIQEASTNGSESYDIPTASFHAGIGKKNGNYVNKSKSKNYSQSKMCIIAMINISLQNVKSSPTANQEWRLLRRETYVSIV
ncbi:Hypothetical predicted protein [Mytilus galloprovincialis]|uniref:Uncharacterized protein n=1 Tax=Mytilus galloprovincialis TaxID=29158 RepID=A0A8B6DFI0_MYTGA|nr:Hypothetical predicted protein [Mytilus galloprovincialis]